MRFARPKEDIEYDGMICYTSWSFLSFFLPQLMSLRIYRIDEFKWPWEVSQ